MDEPHKARVVQAKMQIENLSTAVKKFYLDNGFYPSTEQGLEALVTRPAIGKTPKNYPANGYITKIDLPAAEGGAPHQIIQFHFQMIPHPCTPLCAEHARFL